MTGPIPMDELECPRCGRAGGLEVIGEPDELGQAPVECRFCGRQHAGRIVPLGEAFRDARDPEFDFTGGDR